jgi:pimeloyl-ACP methyl ester carboxylesterase
MARWQQEIGMKGELVRVWTEDELQLQGLYSTPREMNELPAVLHIHGASSNFYRSQFLGPLADELTDRGYCLLSANTRGHDIINNVYAKDPTASRRIGVAFELFEDCLLDLKAWLDFLQRQGREEAVLLGHSFGALKVAFYESETGDERVKALIFVSPADQGFWLEAMGAEMDKTLAWATEMVAQGKGESLFSDRLLPYPMSAGTIHSLFLSGKSDIFRFGRSDEPWETIARLSCPILALMGTVAEYTVPAPEEAMAILKSKALSSPRCDTVVLQGAPHNYRGHESQVTGVITNWLGDVFGG